MVDIWLRAETKPNEQRAPITPEFAGELVSRGYKITVERSSQRIFPAEEYAAVGCELAEAGSWVDAPTDTLILGLKELPKKDTPLIHRHIYFAHAYKGQAGADAHLKRFSQGAGQILDLEYIVDEDNRRVAAFGYMAGYAGAAVSLIIWCQKKLGQPICIPNSFDNREAMFIEIKGLLQQVSEQTGESPNFAIIGPYGRSGRGVKQCLLDAGLDKNNIASLGRQATQQSGTTGASKSMQNLLDYDLVFNCAYIDGHIPPFITDASLTRATDRKLSVIGDISCDPTGPFNPLPFNEYKDGTSFDAPTVRVLDGDNPVDLMAIDHLPSFLPRESSEMFCDQLRDHLLALLSRSNIPPCWQRALDVFSDNLLRVELASIQDDPDSVYERFKQEMRASNRRSAETIYTKHSDIIISRLVAEFETNAIHRACQWNIPELLTKVVEHLLDQKTSSSVNILNKKDDETSKTPLELAVNAHAHKSVKALLFLGADATVAVVSKPERKPTPTQEKIGKMLKTAQLRGRLFSPPDSNPQAPLQQSTIPVRPPH
jgi:saccharopine dehydrogenase (NAD+, L-lysine forming)